MRFGRVGNVVARALLKVGTTVTPGARWVQSLQVLDAIASSQRGASAGRTLGLGRVAGTSPSPREAQARLGARALAQRLAFPLEERDHRLVLADRAGALFRMATGVSPWAVVEFAEQDAATLARVVLAPDNNLLIGPTVAPSGPGQPWRIAFVNLAAYRDVVARHPDDFTRDALADPWGWLETQGLLNPDPPLPFQNVWIQRQRALLSGVPKRAVDAQEIWRDARGSLVEAERRGFEKRGAYTPLEQQRFRKLLLERGGLTVRDIAIALSRRAADPTAALRFDSFHDDDDDDIAVASRCLRAGLLELDAGLRAILCAAAPSLARALESD